jgi:DNA oxidative demethylase
MDLLTGFARAPISVAPDVVLLRQFVDTQPLCEIIDEVVMLAPFRHLTTPNRGMMSVAISNVGEQGWHSDISGYRYVGVDPMTGQPWPAMPAIFSDLAQRAAAAAGFLDFNPNCCLINRYAIGAKMGSHRDQDEANFSHPIVSVSIGLPAVFVWHGAVRSGTSIPVPLEDGDILVWGRSARLGYHAVRAVKADSGMGIPPFRYNLTFRRTN